MARYENAGFGIGRVLARAFATVGENRGTVFGIAFLLAALPQAALTLASGEIATLDDPGLWFFASSGAGSLVSLVSSGIVQAALARVTVEHAEGGHATFRQALWAGVRPALPLIAISFLTGLGLLIGFSLLFFPGVMLWVAWSVTAPSLAEERRGVFAAFGRSRELTSGARWQVFALLLLVLVCYWLFAAVFGLGYRLLAAANATAVVGTWWQPVMAAASKTLSAGLSATITCSLFVELRNWREGPASARLADIFA